MEEWIEYKLGDLYDVHNGLSKGGKFFGSGYPFLSFKTVFNNYFLPPVLPDMVQSNEKEQGGYDIKRGDVFVTRTSETPEELGMSSVALKDYPFATYNGFTKRLRPKETSIIYPEFIGYYLRSTKFRALFYGLASSMSTRASLANGDLLGMKVFLPTFSTQEKIASILKSLDDKIEVNRKINENLEQQAQALFKSWFVDFEPFKNGEFIESELGTIPKGWRVEELENICTIKYGKGLGKNDLTQKGFPVFGGNGIIGFYTQYLYELPQILVSCRGAASGKIIESLPKSYVTSNSLVLELKDRFYYNYLKFLLLSSPLYDYATGSAQPQITIDNIKGVKILLPLQEAIQKMNPTLENIGNIQRTNEQESRRLSELRNTLLPKLMSGELKVNEVENIV